MYYYAGKYEECLTQAEVNLKLIPDDSNAPYYKGLVYLKTGKPEEAVESFQGAFPENREIGSLWAQCRTDEARLSVDKWAKPGVKRTIVFDDNYIATWYAYLGDKESAIAWLQKSFDRRESKMAFINVHPAFATLHDDARFADLLRRVGLAGVLKE
jgi:tetratricopeptide (TPR) repeat protein